MRKTLLFPLELRLVSSSALYYVEKLILLLLQQNFFEVNLVGLFEDVSVHTKYKMKI